MQAILNDMQNNYKTVTLKALAEKLFLSEPYLSRYIKEETGKTFKAILADIRMQHARSMLKTKGATVEQVAEKSGYPSVEHFNRQFKKMFGITPAAYRNQQ